MKRLLVSLACLMVAVGAWAGDTELTLSGSAFNSKTFPTVYQFTIEPLFKVGPFHVGPSVQYADLGDVDGGSVGVAGELNTGKYGGLFVGARYGKNVGDLEDIAKETGELRAGFKLGDKHAAVKVYASQTWSRGVGGEVTDPDGTSVNIGLLIRK